MFSKYFELGLSCIPVSKLTKNPTISGWQRYCEELPTLDLIEAWDRQFKSGLINIGLCTGPVSDIVGVDIDSDEQKYFDLCPLSPVVKRGAKGETRFFRGAKNIPSQSFPKLDILSNGRQTIIPPSIHSTSKKPYIWLTPDTIEIYKELPILKNLDFLEGFSFETNKIKSEGRNNKLVDIITAMRGRGESESAIISEVYRWDLEHHEPRLFTDKDEQYKANTEEEARRGAWTLVNNVTKSLIKRGHIVLSEDSAPIIEIEESDVKPQKRVEYPMPRGILADIVQHTLNQSTRENRALAIGGAIATLAPVVSNRFQCAGIWPNVYILNIAETGAGKSFPQTSAKQILVERLRTNLLRAGGSHSVAALTKGIIKNRERLDVNDEVSTLFRRIKDGGIYQMDLMEALCRLWSESSTLYGGDTYAEREDTSTCYNPCISLFGSTTPSGIRETINKAAFDKGLIPRFLVFNEQGYGRLKDQTFDADLLTRICSDIDQLLKFDRPVDKSYKDQLTGPKYSPVDLAPSSGPAKDLMRHLYDKYQRSLESDDATEVQKAILTRGYEQVLKLATIQAVSAGESFMSLETVEWARDTFEASMGNSASFFQEAAVDSKFMGQMERVKNLVKKSGFMSGRELQRRMDISKKELSVILESCVSAEYLTHCEQMQKSKKVKGYKYLE